MSLVLPFQILTATEERMKFVIAWLIGIVALAVLPIGFGDSVFVNYAIGVVVLSIAVGLWAAFSRKAEPEQQR
ncbi:hypothetical protein [Burkholderia ubonensis]|uniref:hypothetical protein n=1 Tax=Burkholderia ubonensis TaxID=101571 RepID=UPI00075935DD|nr:hypothetical protein [Burkholderia ubonensis]KVL67349.1 hypothetical protein WJ48_13940 [Burkholderia ubonensis]KVL71402.1 hypothetical protein WJ49_20265 [Burkholderia ubonensis]KVL91291.1 hypothetical protein WJ50_11250 [Burkholderia ubonensis]KWK75599.1 hypothetical protein WM15_30605 [Burkholderia ubonensis]